MGLRVWLPLNGSLENQGLEDIFGTNVDATINTAGKIGSCYSFNGTSARIGFPSKTWTYPLSMCAWIKCNNATDSNTEYIGSYNTATGGTAGHNIGFGIYQGKLSLWHGGSVNQYATALSNGIWYHVTAVVTSTSYTLYLNGTSVLSGNTTQSNVNSCFLTLGARSNNASGSTTGALCFFNGYINDFRLYDHALSVKEVRELARGLMVHYKLDDVRLSNANCITNYDPSFHSYPDGAVTLFNNQMNSGTQEIVSDIGGARKCLHLHSNGGSNRQYTTISASAGKSYTVSCDYYSTVAQSQAFRGELNGGDYSWTASQAAPYTTPNEWVRLQFTYSNLTSAATLYYFMYCSNGTDCYIKNIKVEEGTEPTPFSYTNDRPTKVTDDSGFKYHGIIGNTLTAVYDTPRYDCSTYFNTTASKITLPAISFSGTSTTYTFAWWQYMVNTTRMAWGFGNGNRLNVYYSNPICLNTRDGTSTPFQDGTTTINPSELLNSWHHIAVTGDGTAAKIYIDGVYRGTAKTWRAITGTRIYISGWDTGTRYSWSGGKLSDFRIYATALTAADVTDLYATSAEIDRNGNYYSREVIEK